MLVADFITSLAHAVRIILNLVALLTPFCLIRQWTTLPHPIYLSDTKYTSREMIPDKKQINSAAQWGWGSSVAVSSVIVCFIYVVRYAQNIHQIYTGDLNGYPNIRVPDH